MSYSPTNRHNHSTMTYPNGTATGTYIVLSRLPAKDWFTVDEAAQYSGWCRTYIKERIADGTLTAQQSAQKNKRAYAVKRIHVDDLALFIIQHGRGGYSEGKPLQDVLAITRTWPAWLRRHLVSAIEKTLDPKPE